MTHNFLEIVLLLLDLSEVVPDLLEEVDRVGAAQNDRHKWKSLAQKCPLALGHKSRALYRSK